MIHNLSSLQLVSLLDTVFGRLPDERELTLFVDVPVHKSDDNAPWRDRRRIGVEWFSLLRRQIVALPFSALNSCSYPSVGTNNGDLPNEVLLVERFGRDSLKVKKKAGKGAENETVGLKEILRRSSVVLSLTEFSATAPLKILAKELRFRGATLPGFSRNMLPALGLDFEKIHERVAEVKKRMDMATGALVRFETPAGAHEMYLDLRFTTGHASGGLMREPGVVGNLPSGEAYIVPFEGDLAKGESQTAGTLPVQLGSEVVLFSVEKNRARSVLTQGPESKVQRAKLEAEPAYGNIAELGIGVLGEWGVQAAGSILLDEKLGLHIAFGRSEHFGGRTGPSSFTSPANVIHIDWVYVPSVQSLVSAKEVVFTYPDQRSEQIMTDGKVMI